MNNIPQDPVILFSWLNTQLRDHYASLQELCDDRQLDIDTIKATLMEAGFEYNSDRNRFW